MKKKIFALTLALSLIFTLALTLFSCGDDCTSHVDANGDKKCDNCSADMPACTHVDADKNGKCDTCGSDMPPCTAHTDADADKKCDVCGADIPLTEDELKAKAYAEYLAAVKPFSDAKANTSPAEINVTVTNKSVFGDLVSTYKTVYNQDGSSTMSYKKAYLNKVGDSEDDIGYTEGTVTCDAQGNYSDGGSVSGTLGATGFAVNLASDKVIDYKVEGNIFSANIAAENTLSFFGTALPSNAAFIMTINEGKIISVTVSYTDAMGAASIVISYN